MNTLKNIGRRPTAKELKEFTDKWRAKNNSKVISMERLRLLSYYKSKEQAVTLNDIIKMSDKEVELRLKLVDMIQELMEG